MIACSQRKPNKHDIIFLEKNGLQHGEFSLLFQKDEKVVSIRNNTYHDYLSERLGCTFNFWFLKGGTDSREGRSFEEEVHKTITSFFLFSQKDQ